MLFRSDVLHPFLWVINSSNNAISSLIPLTDSKRSGHTTASSAISGTSNRVVVASRGAYDELIIVTIPATNPPSISFYPFADPNTGWTTLSPVPNTVDTEPVDVVDYSAGQSIFAALDTDYSIGVLNQGTGKYIGRIPLLDPNNVNMRPTALDISSSGSIGVVVAQSNLVNPMVQLLTFSPTARTITGRVNLVDESNYKFYPTDVMIDTNGTLAYVSGRFGNTSSTYGVLVVNIANADNPYIVDKTQVEGGHNPVDFSALGQYLQIKFGKYNTSPTQFYVANNLSDSFTIMNFNGLTNLIDQTVNLNQ